MIDTCELGSWKEFASVPAARFELLQLVIKLEGFLLVQSFTLVSRISVPVRLI